MEKTSEKDNSQFCRNVTTIMVSPSGSVQSITNACPNVRPPDLGPRQMYYLDKALQGESSLIYYDHACYCGVFRYAVHFHPTKIGGAIFTAAPVERLSAKQILEFTDMTKGQP